MFEVGWGTIPLVLGLIFLAIVVGAYFLGKGKK